MQLFRTTLLTFLSLRHHVGLDVRVLGSPTSSESSTELDERREQRVMRSRPWRQTLAARSSASLSPPSEASLCPGDADDTLPSLVSSGAPSPDLSTDLPPALRSIPRPVSSKAAPRRYLKLAREHFSACLVKVKAKTKPLLSEKGQECAGGKPRVAEGVGGVKSGCLDHVERLGRALAGLAVAAGGSLTKSASLNGSKSTRFASNPKRSALKGARGHHIREAKVKFDEVRRVKDFRPYRRLDSSLDCGPCAWEAGTKLTRLCACESGFTSDGSVRERPYKGADWIFLPASKMVGCDDLHCARTRWGPRLEKTGS